MSVFVNNVAVLAVENCLVKDLSEIFSPIMVADMSTDRVFAIAAESVEVRERRASLKAKLEVLQNGQRVLNEHLGKLHQVVLAFTC